MRYFRAGLMTLSAFIFVPVLAALGQTEPHHVGQTIPLTKDLKLDVVTAGLDAFSKEHIQLTGVAKVFEVRFLKSDANLTVALEPWNDPANSGVVLELEDTRVAPKALAYRTKKSSEGEEVIEVAMVKDLARNRKTGRGLWLGSSPKPMVQLLFDISKEIADSPAKLRLEILVDFKQPPIIVEIVQ